jgi:glycerol-3-phosphate O-acyltransferase
MAVFHRSDDPGKAVRSLYIVQSPSEVERAIIDRWIAQHGAGGDAAVVTIPAAASLGLGDADRFDEAIRSDSDPTLRPVRVVWLPKERNGERRALARDLLLGDPRRPQPWRQEWLRRKAPGRYQVIGGEPATLSQLRARHAESNGDPGDRLAFLRFVARRATLALERAEYRAVGVRYKVPKLVREEVLESPRFADGVARLASELGRDEAQVRAEAMKCLDEMAAGYTPLFLDLFAQVGKFICRPGYGEEIDFEPDQVDMLRGVFQEHPAVVLPSHKSQLDGLVMARALHDSGLPPTHIFAGINMNIWPFGPVFRRAGRIFIRRSTKGDPVYRWVLREYIGYLTEKRFNLEWYLEGGRSRTGKLLPPKLGLLRYLVDAYSDGRTDDIAFVPVSIAYDELHEVSEYSGEAVGGTKKAEGLGWAVRFYRGQRRRFGKIYVRFAEPVSLRAAIGSPSLVERSADERSLDIQKLAFEVSWRINQVTPITASSLVSLVLLATRGRALTSQELHLATRSLLAEARARRLPRAASAERLQTEEGLRAVLDSLAGNRTIEVYAGGREPVYRVAAGQHLSAAFYRNTIIHFFVDGSIAELALVRAAEHDGDRLAAFWDEAYHLRDLLKFEFFFEAKDEFSKAITTQLTERLPGWEARLAEGGDPLALLADLQPLRAFAVLRPFVEAYSVVARALEALPGDAPVDEQEVLRSCLPLGQQLVRQQHIRSPESVSKLLFANGIQLAANLGLTEPSEDVAKRRAAFVAELADVGRRIDSTEQLTYVALNRSLTVAGR